MLRRTSSTFAREASDAACTTHLLVLANLLANHDNFPGIGLLLLEQFFPLAQEPGFGILPLLLLDLCFLVFCDA